ncbi:acyl-CoA thioester hydrolase [Oceanobacillus oncorhynchi subsp. incaldanensis]|uniref:alpha/beta fold hydrolase n=1 Tax=Oceanobacillus TaxID=182709 RepID=UPI001B25D277|nr:alpha/beta hydrolase [Oceanobacillus oncorhynchi]GIO17530.1 acyl-CoA thioester hydrolase [Oceanobacillus oncorhynchi subsp. incaldanensis]
MNCIFVHGLGQNAASWQRVIDYTETDSHQIASPDLFLSLEEGKVNYHHLYQRFYDYCERLDGPIHLCGLSLGAILSLNYALDRPEKVQSLLLISPQYKMPGFLLSLQNVIFRMLPSPVFQKMGLPKKDVIQLTNSMKQIDFNRQLADISCPTLILCGEKDKPNKKAAEQLSSLIAGASLKIIRKAGHEANVDNPQELAEIINDFWSESVLSPSQHENV